MHPPANYLPAGSCLQFIKSSFAADFQTPVSFITTYFLIVPEFVKKKKSENEMNSQERWL